MIALPGWARLPLTRSLVMDNDGQMARVVWIANNGLLRAPAP